MADKISNKTGNTLVNLVEDIFVPTQRQREVKAKFWSSWKQGPSKGEPTLSAVIQETGVSAIEGWWRQPEFRDWFLNDRDAQQRLEYLFDKGIDVLDEIMTSAEKAADRLKAIELVAKLAQKITKPETEVKYLDSDIQKMSPEQLETFIKGMLPKGENREEENKN